MDCNLLRALGPRRILSLLFPAVFVAVAAGHRAGALGAVAGFLAAIVAIGLLAALRMAAFLVVWCGFAGSRNRFRHWQFWAASIAVGVTWAMAGAAARRTWDLAWGPTEAAFDLAAGLFLLPVASFIAGLPRGWRLLHADAPGTLGWRRRCE